MNSFDPVTILYTNYRGETTVRHIQIVQDKPDRFGTSEWHPEPQWLFEAYDIEKQAYREFARAGVKAWGEEDVNLQLEIAKVLNRTVKYFRDKKAMKENKHWITKLIAMMEDKI